MTRDDLAPLAAIFAEVVEDGETYADEIIPTLTQFETYWCGRGGEQWVALEDGRVAGGYTLRPNHPGRGAHVGTASYVVRRTARGHGVGRRLGQHSLLRARALGFSSMQFNFVVGTNLAAVRLWEHLGFRTLARLPGAFRHAKHGPVDALVMFRDLAAPDPEPALVGRVHQAIVRSFLEEGRPPGAGELASRLDRPRDHVEAALRALEAAHGVVLHPGTLEVWIAHPFSASPSAVWVAASDGRGWWAPCLWCAAGIVALGAGDATLHARLGGEARDVRIEVRDGRLASADLAVHFALPVRRAWDNVVHWCATVAPFDQDADVSRWCARHGASRGDVVPLSRVLELGREWYGGHLRADWRKWTLGEARAIFERVGLRGEVWSLPAGDERF
jgi:L-amino acid N-acyltransferase YncA